MSVLLKNLVLPSYYLKLPKYAKLVLRHITIARVSTFNEILIKFTMSRKNPTELFTGEALRINTKWKSKLSTDDERRNASLVNYYKLRMPMKSTTFVIRRVNG